MPLYKILYTLVVAPLWWQKSSNFLKLFLCSYKKLFYICNRNRVNERAISSVGSEHLPYKQGVTGSNPVSPTTCKTFLRYSFVCDDIYRAISSVGSEHLLYKQWVTGSNPVSTTTYQTSMRESFFCEYIDRAISSVGSEHLPYKQGVTGSNPVSPTISNKLFNFLKGFFVF